MAEQQPKQSQPQTCNTDACDPSTTGGPPTDVGGTTGAGNLSPGGADRTGGASAGVTPGHPSPAGRPDTPPPSPPPAKKPGQ